MKGTTLETNERDLILEPAGCGPIITSRQPTLITYIATSSVSEGQVLSSLDNALQAIDIFGHLCIPVHYAATQQAKHDAGYAIAKRAYMLRPDATPPVIAHKVFDRNVTEVMPPDAWDSVLPGSANDWAWRYAAYMNLCCRKIMQDFGAIRAALVDHPNAEFIKSGGPWAMGDSPIQDAEIRSVLDDGICHIRGFAPEMYAYGHPFWCNDKGRGWFDLDGYNASSTSYSKTYPQPTVETVRARFKELQRYSARRRAMFFALSAHEAQKPQTVANIHRHDQYARHCDALILYPQIGQGNDLTDPALAREYMRAMKG